MPAEDFRRYWYGECLKRTKFTASSEFKVDYIVTRSGAIPFQDGRFSIPLELVPTHAISRHCVRINLSEKGVRKR
jgi:hypothetical protein